MVPQRNSPHLRDLTDLTEMMDREGCCRSAAMHKSSPLGPTQQNLRRSTWGRTTEKERSTNKDALDATRRKEKNALFANCSAWVAKAKEKGAEEHMRKMRIASSLECFQSYRLAVYQAIAKEEPVPKFKAPVPKMRDGLSALCELYTGLFASEKMVTSLIKCFQSVGLAMTTAGGCEPHFKKYQLGTRHGAQPTAKPSTDDTYIYRFVTWWDLASYVLSVWL